MGLACSAHGAPLAAGRFGARAGLLRRCPARHDMEGLERTLASRLLDPGGTVARPRNRRIPRLPAPQGHRGAAAFSWSSRSTDSTGISGIFAKTSRAALK